jgi:dihydrofolate synthase/folylpolyglutamate synthase
MSPPENRGVRSAAYQRALRQLYSLGKFGVKLGLHNITALLDGLNNPQRSYPSIHVAGSNGKGSVASLLAATLQAAGYRVGLYTSPHLVDFRERIRVDGRLISRRGVVRLWTGLRPRVRQLKATYFEVVTAMAFSYFRDRNVDVAVVETGLGGRLDATNVLLPHAAVITNVTREHTKWLGTRLDQIAREKAGIIKEGVPVICAETRKTPLDVIRAACRRRSAILHLLDEELGWKVEEASLDGSDLLIEGERGYYGSLYLGLAGRHQVRNAMTALLSLQVLRNIGWNIPMRAVRRGFSLVDWPGRLQVVQRFPLVLLDVAHNPAGALALKEALQEFLPHSKVCFVLGVQEDKEIAPMIRHLAPVAERFVLTKARWKGAMAPEVIAAVVKARGLPFQIRRGVRGAMRTALGLPAPEKIASRFAEVGPLFPDQTIFPEEPVVCITGSHYVVGEAMEALGIRP